MRQQQEVLAKCLHWFGWCVGGLVCESLCVAAKYFSDALICEKIATGNSLLQYRLSPLLSLISRCALRHCNLVKLIVLSVNTSNTSNILYIQQCVVWKFDIRENFTRPDFFNTSMIKMGFFTPKNFENLNYWIESKFVKTKYLCYVNCHYVRFLLKCMAEKVQTLSQSYKKLNFTTNKVMFKA